MGEPIQQFDKIQDTCNNHWSLERIQHKNSKLCATLRLDLMSLPVDCLPQAINHKSHGIVVKCTHV